MTDEQLLQIAANHVGKRDAADFSELDLVTTERSELIAFGRAVEAELKKANTKTSDDIPFGSLSEAELREQWNAQADEFNQWDSLDSYEQLAWAQVQAIAAHEVASAPVPGWQPISTAPRDGTEILASDYDAIEIVNWNCDPSPWEWDSQTGDGPAWCDRDGLRMFPAWWQPLPDHPPIPTPTKTPHQ